MTLWPSLSVFDSRGEHFLTFLRGSRVLFASFISVTHHVEEAALHRMLINRIARYAEVHGFLTDTQFGVCKAHNTEQAITVLHWLLKARCLAGKSRQRRTWAAFLDCKSAFDSVWNEGLCVRLFKIGIRGRALSYLRASLLMSSRRSVRCDDAPIDESSAWRDTRGVAQASSTRRSRSR